MIQRRVTEFWKSAIFLVVILLSENLVVSASKCRFLMVCSIGVAVNDDSEACDNIFLTGHLMSRNLV